MTLRQNYEGNLDETSNDNYNNELDPTSPPPATADSSSSSIKRKCAQDIREKFIELEKKKLEILQNNLSQSSGNQQQDCEDMLFFRSLLPFMKDLSLMQKLRARNRITQVIMDEMNSGTTATPA